MQRLTLGRARAILDDACFPVGAKASAATAAPPINMALANLLNTGKWLGTQQKAAFTIYDDQKYITLPRIYQTVLAGAIQGTGDRFRYAWTYPVQNEWFQWIPGGYGLNTNPPNSTTGFQVAGDGYVIFRDLPTAGQIRLVTTTTETPATFSIRGYDSNGAKVFTGAGASRIEGENITIPAGSGASVTTSTTWNSGNSLYSIVKPSTNGEILIYCVSGSTETLIGRYAPGELLPSYRRYFVPRTCCNDNEDQAVVFCKVQHVDVVVDNDEIYPGNANALENAMMALNYRRKDVMDRYQAYMAEALAALNSDQEDATAEQSRGTIQIDPQQGMGLVQNLL